MRQIKSIVVMIGIGMLSACAWAGFAPDADNTSFVGLPGYRYAQVNGATGNFAVINLNDTNINVLIPTLANWSSLAANGKVMVYSNTTYVTNLIPSATNLSVTGTLDPDVTGTNYVPIEGGFDGFPGWSNITINVMVTAAGGLYDLSGGLALVEKTFFFSGGLIVTGLYVPGENCTGTATVAYWYTYGPNSTNVTTNTTIQQWRGNTNAVYGEYVFNNATTTLWTATATGMFWGISLNGNGPGLTNIPLAGVIGAVGVSNSVAILLTNTVTKPETNGWETGSHAAFLSTNGVNGTDTVGTAVSDGQVDTVGTNEPWLVASADGMSGCPSGAAPTGDFANVINRVTSLESSYQSYSATNYAVDGTVTVSYANGPAIKMTMTNDPTVIVFAADYPDNGINRVAINVFPGTNTSLGFVVGNVTNPVAPVITNFSPAQLIFRTEGTNLPWVGGQIIR
jgi:hypothetical protein